MKVRRATATEKFLRAVNEITSNNEQFASNDDGYWFMRYEEAEMRATAAETELASLRAQIAVGQLVDVRTLPKNVSYTFTRQTW